MKNSVFVKEIFESIQGEGPYTGYLHLFVRFSRCNLKCSYCDTDFKTGLKEYTADELLSEIKKHVKARFLSLTGGEPLLEADFLSDFLPLVNKTVYLETNGVLFDELKKIINYVDIISADIKLNSSSGNGNLFDNHEKFARIAKEHSKEIFFKTVFNDNITDEEINSVISLVNRFDIPLILQPQSDSSGKISVNAVKMSKIFKKFSDACSDVRLMAQMHKFLNLR